MGGVMPHRWDNDQHLLDDLGDAVREAARSGPLAQLAKGLYSWRSVETDLLLASLDFDSSLEPVQGWRSEADEARVLVFTAPPLSVELEVMDGHAAGQIVPPGPAEIWVESADMATFRVEADSAGFFILPNTPRGLVRLRCDTPAGRLVTGWMRL
jgi:hypothetical protein